MGDLKKWHIVLFVLAIVGLGFTVWWTLSDDSVPEGLTHRLVMVDVTTGDLFEMSTRRKAAVIPEVNPDSGKATLFPVHERDGKWYLIDRYLSALGQGDAKPDAVIDQSSGEVRVTNTSPKRM
jgi:hypothetical protein